MAKKATTEKWVLMTELGGEPLLHHFKLSSLGNVVKIKKGVGNEEPFEPKKIGGYKYISFTTRKGNRETIYLHRLVAEFFVDNGDETKSYVIHKDYDRTNNYCDNLEWTDQAGLYKHRGVKAGRSAGNKNSKKRVVKGEGSSSRTKADERTRVRKIIGEYYGVTQ